MEQRGRLVINRVNLAVNDTDYTLKIPTGATNVRVAVNAAVDWRFGTESVAAAGSGMPVAASQAVQLTTSIGMRETELHLAVSSGAGVSTYAVLSCVVPPVR